MRRSHAGCGAQQRGAQPRLAAMAGRSHGGRRPKLMTVVAYCVSMYGEEEDDATKK